MTVFTFWEGKTPDYIKLCLKTWKVPYTLLNYDTVRQYTDLNTDILRGYGFTLPQIADCVRVHVLRDNGGYWLDADTIMLSDNLPAENMIGYPEKRDAHCGYLHFKKHSDFLAEWAEEQDRIISQGIIGGWDLFSNGILNKLLKTHNEVTIKDRTEHFPESYMIISNSKYTQYQEFYFNSQYHLSDIKKTNIIMLHNSWTPGGYMDISEREILNSNYCTMSNILRAAI